MEQISAVEDFLTCPVCLETFKEPVSLGCNHSFCSSCLKVYWDKNTTKECPVCRRKSSKENLLVNFGLKQLSLSFSQKKPAPAGEREKFCSSHPEQSPLFCLDECGPLCPACEFSLHYGHKVVCVDSAVSELKEQLRSQLQPLTRSREQASASQRQYEEINLHAQTQVEECERQIRAEFERLHRFLQQEEESVLRALREEQSRQNRTIEAQLQKIREKLSTLEQNILTVEEQLKRQSMDFIREFRHTHNTTQTLLSQPEPEPGPGLLINQAKVLGNMGFKAWDKMRALVHYSPVLLDPNTASGWLHLSEDLRGVRLRDTEQQVPDIPERFTYNKNDYDCGYSAVVLGSEGFSSRSHQWDVKVRDHPSWVIGVAKESVYRKGIDTVHPISGFWCLEHYDGQYTDVVGKTLKLNRSPQKIRVTLDYDEGKLSFFDVQNKSLICSHQQTFREKVFPYFSVGKAGDAKTKGIQICSSDLVTGAFPSDFGPQAGYSVSQGKHRDIDTDTVFGWWEEPEILERTHRKTRRTCRLHPGKPQHPLGRPWHRAFSYT